jgi:hypothetical protein
VLKKDVFCGKIIETLLTTQPHKMLPGFPVPIPEIVVLPAAPIFPGAFDSKPLKIVHENLAVISHECFQRAGFIETEVCLAFCSVFGRRKLFYCVVSIGFETVNAINNCTPQLSMKYTVPLCLLYLSRDVNSIKISLKYYN